MDELTDLIVDIMDGLNLISAFGYCLDDVLRASDRWDLIIRMEKLGKKIDTFNNMQEFLKKDLDE